MSSVFHIASISEMHQVFGYPPPKHPLISVIDLSKISLSDNYIGNKATSGFYTIALKVTSKQTFKYGRELFDFDSGCLYGIAPNQIGEVVEAYNIGEMEGWALYFHPDLIHGYQLSNTINSFGFFSYTTHEALHVSENEKKILFELIDKITLEYNNTIDDFSEEILVTNIELLLTYIKRYYNRQFITRKKNTQSIVAKFETLLHSSLITKELSNPQKPTVKRLAAELHLSSAYLSDLLKKETGKSAQEHIHYALLEKAKNLLIKGELSVTEIAYELGFEYPAYFTRFFKKNIGIPPTQYKNQLN